MRGSLEKTTLGSNNQRGQGLTEYAVVLSLVALAGIFSVTLLGSSLRAKFGELTGQVSGNGTMVTNSTARLGKVATAAETEMGRASSGMNNRSGFTAEENSVGGETGSEQKKADK